MRLSSSSLAIARARTSRSVSLERLRMAAIWPPARLGQMQIVMMQMLRKYRLRQWVGRVTEWSGRAIARETEVGVRPSTGRRRNVEAGIAVGGEARHRATPS